MVDQFWSWLLGIVGLLGFYLAGRRVWWAWYVNIINQIFWLAYSIITGQLGFLVTTFAYFFVFSKNAYQWTRDYKRERAETPK